MRKLFLFAALLMVYSILSFGEESAGSGAPKEVTITITPNSQIGSLLTLLAEREKRPIICEDAPIKTATLNMYIPPEFKVPIDKYNIVMDYILDSTLRMKGYVLLRSDPIWKVVKMEQAREHPALVNPLADIEKLVGDDRVVTQVLQLKYADAQTLSAQLSPLRGRSDASYLALAETNTLIITDYASNIRRYYDIIKMLDQEGATFQTEIRKLEHASATFVKTNLDQYIQAIQASTRQRPGVPLLTPRVLFDDRTNSLIVIAQEKDMKPLTKMIDMFDSDISKKETNYYVYKVTNTMAEDVARIINAIYTKQLAPMQASLKTSEKTISIEPDKNTNSLIISAPPAIYEDILELIKKIDIKKMQVLLEVIIAELTDEKMMQLGVELASLKEPGDKMSGFGGTNVGISTPDATSGGKSPNIPSVKDAGGSLTIGLWKNTRFDIPFLLQASQKDSGVDLKAAPVLLANDTTEATINMSDLAPYFTTTYPGGTGQPAQTTFGGYVEAKIELKITPYISSDDYIRLIIEQTSEQFLGNPGQDTPKSSRKAKTTVTVADKDTVVIGGLTRETKSKIVSKVPFFGDIPLLGYFFKHTTDSVRKTHLCIFIKPNIMKEFSDLTKKTAETQKELNKQKDSIDEHHGDDKK
ncbi:MAG: secretin N-terminal domain-containing protein [Planctomycetota bacterium]